jgi:hypothetical protein
MIACGVHETFVTGCKRVQWAQLLVLRGLMWCQQDVLSDMRDLQPPITYTPCCNVKQSRAIQHKALEELPTVSYASLIC